MKPRTNKIDLWYLCLFITTAGVFSTVMVGAFKGWFNPDPLPVRWKDPKPTKTLERSLKEMDDGWARILAKMDAANAQLSKLVVESKEDLERARSLNAAINGLSKHWEVQNEPNIERENGRVAISR